MLRAFGDSFSNPGTGATAGNAYLTLLSAAIGAAFANHAAPGAQAADQSIQAHNISMASGDKATVMAGTNDQWKYGANVYKQGLFRSFLTALVASTALPSKVNANSSGMSLSGNWTTSQPSWSRGKWSYTAGNTATATVSGTAVYVGVIRQDDLNGNAINGTADVYVDSVKVGSITSAGTGMTTHNGNTYAPAVFRFGGLPAGAHTVQIVITSAIPDYRGMMYVEYIAGPEQAAMPEVHVANIANMTASAYSSIGGSSANTAAYCAAIQQIVSDFAGDGLNVKFVDVNSVVLPASDLSADGCHPNDSGHLKIKNAFLASIVPAAPGPLPVLAEVKCFHDAALNIFYIGEGAARKRIETSSI